MHFLLFIFSQLFSPQFFQNGNGPSCACICIWRSIDISKLKYHPKIYFLLRYRGNLEIWHIAHSGALALFSIKTRKRHINFVQDYSSA